MTLHFEPWQKRVLIGLAGVAVLCLAVLAFTAGRIAAAPHHPDGNSADAGFARDMQVHHAQAVEMSMIVRDRTDDDVVRAIAYDIALTQQGQIGQMYAWLEEWSLPQSTAAPRMAWMAGAMDHHGGAGMDLPGADGLMPGMGTDEQLTELSAASGEEAERVYLTLMITHHEAGAEMAQAGAELAQDPTVRDAAEKMMLSQENEIAAMEDLLAEL